MNWQKAKVVSILVAAFFALLGVSALATAPPFPVKWQGVLAPVPQATFYEATCAYNGKIYVFGGGVFDTKGNSIFLNNTQIYDPALNAWTAGPDGTDIGAFSSAVEAGGLIYVMGGMTGGTSDLQSLNRVYDPSSNTWLANKKAMPEARRGHMACAVNGKIYVFGGKDSSNSATDTVSIYDPASDTWSSGAAMPYKATYGAAVWVASKSRIYYVGGTDMTTYYANALTYDPVANAWDSAQVPLLTGTAVFASAFDPDSGKIYVCSGQSSDANGVFAVTQNQILDTSTNTVSEGALMPSPMARESTAGAYVGGKMYLFGGEWGCGHLVDVYDPDADSWYEPTPKLPDLGISGMSVAAIGGKIYALNGGSYNGINDKILVLDPAGGGWTATNAVNPDPRLYGTSDVYDGKIVCSGGLDVNDQYGGDTYLYDPATDTFSDLAPDPTPRIWAAGALVNGVFYVFGGAYGGDALNTVNALDIASNTWIPKKPLPKTLFGPCACAFGGKIYLFGGQFPHTGVLSPDFYVYDPAADSYQDLGPMPEPVYAGGCAVYEKYILVVGDAAASLSLVQVYDPAANAWYTADNLFSRDYAGVAVAAGRLYVVGGESFLLSDVGIDRTGIADLSGLGATASADPASGGIPLTVSFSATVTGGTEPYTYDWDFKDGSDHGTTATPSHTFTTVGTYDVTLTVTDANGGTAQAHVQVTATAPTNPPVIAAMKKSGSPFKFVVTGSNLQSGIQVFIGSDTTAWSSVTWKSAGKVIIGGSSLKAKVPKGTPTVFHFKNPDGGAADFTFQW